MKSRLVIALILAMTAVTPVFGGGGGGGGGGGRGGRGGGRTAGGAGGPNNADRMSAMGGGGMTGGVRGGRGMQIQLSDSYAILDTTSIFAQNRRAVGDTSDQIIIPPPQRGTAPVFRGTMIDDTGAIALMEIQQGGGTVAEYLRAGDSVPYNNSKVIEVTLDHLRLSRVQISADSLPYMDLPPGFDLDGNQVGVMPSTPSYISADMQGLTAGQNNQGGRGGRGGRGGGNFGGNFGGNLGGNFGGNFGGGNYNAGRGGGMYIGSTATGVATAIVNPSLDPPLPPGSADNLAGRMAARRAAQVAGSAAPASAAPAPGASATPATSAGGR
jgi:hypothetical protein